MILKDGKVIDETSNKQMNITNNDEKKRKEKKENENKIGFLHSKDIPYEVQMPIIQKEIANNENFLKRKLPKDFFQTAIPLIDYNLI